MSWAWTCPPACGASVLAGGRRQHREEVESRPGRYRTFVHSPLERVPDLAGHVGLAVVAGAEAPDAGRDTVWLLASQAS